MHNKQKNGMDTQGMYRMVESLEAKVTAKAAMSTASMYRYKSAYSAKNAINCLICVRDVCLITRKKNLEKIPIIVCVDANVYPNTVMVKVSNLQQ